MRRLLALIVARRVYLYSKIPGVEYHSRANPVRRDYFPPELAPYICYLPFFKKIYRLGQVKNACIAFELNKISIHHFSATDEKDFV